MICRPYDLKNVVLQFNGMHKNHPLAPLDQNETVISMNDAAEIFYLSPGVEKVWKSHENYLITTGILRIIKYKRFIFQ